MIIKKELQEKMILFLIKTDAPIGDIQVGLLDIKLNSGRIQIYTDTGSWSSQWDSMGGGSDIAHFFIQCDSEYLARCLERGIVQEVIDVDAVNKATGLSLGESFVHGTRPGDHEVKVLEQHYGADWVFSLPTVPNPRYCHLIDVIKWVKQGLAIYVESAATEIDLAFSSGGGDCA